jgi:hypothetical protein
MSQPAASVRALDDRRRTFEAWLVAGAPAAGLSVGVIGAAEPAVAGPLAAAALSVFLPVGLAMLLRSGEDAATQPMRIARAGATGIAALAACLVALGVAPPTLVLMAIVLAFAFDMSQSARLGAWFAQRRAVDTVAALLFVLVPTAALLGRLAQPEQSLFGIDLPQLAISPFVITAVTAGAVAAMVLWLFERGRAFLSGKLALDMTAAELSHAFVFVAAYGLAPSLEAALLITACAFGLQALMLARHRIGERFNWAIDDDAIGMSSFARPGEGLIFSFWVIALSGVAAGLGITTIAVFVSPLVVWVALAAAGAAGGLAGAVQAAR